MNICKGRLYQQLPTIVLRHTLVEAKCWPCLEMGINTKFPVFIALASTTTHFFIV
ncbi:hypothetical protein NC651_011642 [Populus alba x Populus x berolinensis]|nr:hypothetical protein NC651_011639 [Populus alba x Populus x berolinensis]KAJ6927672.1 hypothetical protein NC651_011642 [Populus alba x Populus x berolinensis]